MKLTIAQRMNEEEEEEEEEEKLSESGKKGDK